MKSKWKYYSEKLLQFQGGAKTTWRIMKKVIGKCNTYSLNLWNYNTKRNSMQESPFIKSIEFGIPLK